MYKIVKREDLAPNVHLFVIDAPAVAKKAQPGQFLIVRNSERGERIPLTIADFDRAAGTVSFAFMEVGKTTREMGLLKEGDSLATFVGPLGEATHIKKYGTVVCVGGGFGTATVSPIARAMKEAGNHVITIMGFRSQSLMFWEDKLRDFSSELIVTTDDGSYGRKSVVTEPLKEMLQDPARTVDLVVAIGPAIMMKFVSKTTEPFGTPTVVSLNPIMMDGTGMCGACRVSVGGKTKFACVDGPDFDGHQVDWDLLLARQKIFIEHEKRALELWQCQACREQNS
ncbi:MAG: sulfide/dihydroorotate dehydrogenase-like FAD/NAD-binding protein [Chloroflexota bacterium]|nr:MAG: sulfide/dihydroorotate dehydrogenase-like FAD/NAD-binding protein [Chloroflexota bacterium]